MSIGRSAPTIKAAVRALRGASLPRPLSLPHVAALNHGDGHVLKRVATTPVPPSFPNPITARETFVTSHLHSHSILLMSRNSPTASHYRPPCSWSLSTTASLVDGQQDFLEEMSIYKNEPSPEVKLRVFINKENSEFKWLREFKKAAREREKVRVKMEIAEKAMEKAEIDVEEAEVEMKKAEMEMEKAKVVMKVDMEKMKIVNMKMKMEMSKIDMMERERGRAGKETKNLEKELNTLERQMEKLEREMKIVMEIYLEGLQRVKNFVNMKDLDKWWIEMDKLGNEMEIVMEDYLKKTQKVNN